MAIGTPFFRNCASLDLEHYEPDSDFIDRPYLLIRFESKILNRNVAFFGYYTFSKPEIQHVNCHYFDV
jgi:hypothetical protein